MECMNHIEIEVKSLLGTQEAADVLKGKILAEPYQAVLKGRNAQLNHYFVGDTEKLFEVLGSRFDEEKRKKLEHILKEGKNHSIRTRSYQDGSPVLLVVKASIGDDTSANGVSRIEFEERVGGLDIAALDQLLLDAGLSYQAKWSREREEYALADGTVVCLDKNAGYGYLAEFERIAEDAAEIASVQESIRELMNGLGVEELPQDRLERMFVHYNAHWPEYYGTEKIFVVE